jgi:formylglycine-generating enzyme required for sulfatase activity
MTYLKLLAALAALPLLATTAHAAKAPPAGKVFRDCRDCPEMVVVPPGEFTMGREGGETDRYEGPLRRVQIPYSFAVGRFELTNGQYRAFVQATGHKTAGTGCNAFFATSVKALPNTNWADPGYGRPIATTNPSPASAGAMRRHMFRGSRAAPASAIGC